MKFKDYINEKGTKDIKATHPGILEVPDGKEIDDMDIGHFMKLAKKKGRGPIVKALMNLYRWNTKENPPLSKWAKNMQELLSKKLDIEEK